MYIQLKNRLWTTIAFLHCCNLIWGLENNNYSLYFLQFLTVSIYVCARIWIENTILKILGLCYIFELILMLLSVFFIHNYLKDIYSMSHFYFCLPWLLESCIPVIFLYKKCMYPPFFFLLKYYCAVIQYHTNCNKSYLCSLQ
jgi:hypothetical protein